MTRTERTEMTKIPRYSFADSIGPSFRWFAWYPVRLYYGRWAWLRAVRCQRVQKKPFLDGPDWEFWSYSDYKEQNENETTPSDRVSAYFERITGRPMTRAEKIPLAAIIAGDEPHPKEST